MSLKNSARTEVSASLFMQQQAEWSLPECFVVDRLIDVG
jgi:hypothetical protein